MQKTWLATALLVAAVASAPLAHADQNSGGTLTVAVFGDWPYAPVGNPDFLLQNAPLLVNSVNSDPDVAFIIHVGDIHSGNQPCTSAGILPPISTSIPDWNQQIYFQFQQFQKPFIYTPGDNEWTDCHKTKESKSGAPLKELASVRSLFFARPGHTFGLEDMPVTSQAMVSDPESTDAHYVENVMWEDIPSRTVFATLNVPGSNNDTLPWTNGFEDPVLHPAEVMQRNAANMHWLDAAFDVAEQHHDKAVVIALQADMWDLSALQPGGDGLNAYTPFVQELATQALHFGRPVLLINGDSHLFEVDQPLADPSSAKGQVHNTQAVKNLTRITVQGSTNPPAEWLRLSIGSNPSNPFSWVNVPYCANPSSATCQ
jgi:Calcineurin-like phosphoesterase